MFRLGAVIPIKNFLRKKSVLHPCVLNVILKMLIFPKMSLQSKVRNNPLKDTLTINVL